jgi:selenocysteine lyase/cysteine desulfurase
MGAFALPLAIGLGAAVERLQAAGVEAELARNAALRDHLHERLASIPGVHPLGPPPRTRPTGLLGFRLPDGADAGKLRAMLLARHRLNLRAVDPAQWNGLRACVHVYNDAAQADALVAALRQELGA